MTVLESEDVSVAGVCSGWASRVTYGDLPREVQRESIKLITNSVGTAIGGYPLTDVQIGLQILREEALGGDRLVLLSGDRAPLASALFVNALMFNCLGQEETHVVTAVHPAEVIVPVLLTHAIHGSINGRPVTGESFLEALIIGSEIAVALNIPDFLPMVRAQNLNTAVVYGAAGAAAALAKLRGLSIEKTANALRLAVNLATGLSECFRAGTTEFHYSLADAAVSASRAVALADHDVKAAPEVFEGEAGLYRLHGGLAPKVLRERNVAEEISQELRARWRVLDIVYKPYPVHIFNLPYIDAADSLRKLISCSASEIGEIAISLTASSAAYGGGAVGPFVGRDAVVGSTPFCVAAMLARGKVTSAELNAYQAADILALVGKTVTSLSDEPLRGRIDVTMKGGTKYSADIAFDVRAYRSSFEDIEQVYRAATSGVIDSESSEELLNSLKSLETSVDVGRAVVSGLRMPSYG